MGVGSSAGSSAAQGPGSGTGSRSSARTSPVDPSSSSTSAGATSFSARVVWVFVHPVHQRRSSAVPGPYARSQSRASSARAASVSQGASPSGSQAESGDQRYWCEVHEPRGRPRTALPSAASRSSRRAATLWPRACREAPPIR
ncbi:hypothetical protein GA0115236_119436, partial [Streptomyces sp. IgraMP-1]